MEEMMKRIAGLALCIASVLFSSLSCQREGSEKVGTASGRPVAFTVMTKLAPSTRTVFNGYVAETSSGVHEGIDWKMNDDMMVYCPQADGERKSTKYVVTSVVSKENVSEPSTAKTTGQPALKWGEGAHTFYAVYPHPADGNNVTMTQNRIRGTVPARFSLSQTYQDYVTAWYGPGDYDMSERPFFCPGMDQAFMYAVSHAESGDDVSLEFKPLFTAFEFQVGAYDYHNWPYELGDPPAATPVVKVTLKSDPDHGSYLAGSFTATLGADGTPDIRLDESTCTRSIEVNLGAYDEFATVVFFALPVKQTMLSLEFTFADGSSKTLPLKQNGEWIEVEAMQKAYFDNVIIPFTSDLPDYTPLTLDLGNYIRPYFYRYEGATPVADDSFAGVVSSQDDFYASMSFHPYEMQASWTFTAGSTTPAVSGVPVKVWTARDLSVYNESGEMIVLTSSDGTRYHYRGVVSDLTGDFVSSASTDGLLWSASTVFDDPEHPTRLQFAQEPPVSYMLFEREGLRVNTSMQVKGNQGSRDQYFDAKVRFWKAGGTQLEGETTVTLRHGETTSCVFYPEPGHRPSEYELSAESLYAAGTTSADGYAFSRTFTRSSEEPPVYNLDIVAYKAGIPPMGENMFRWRGLIEPYFYEAQSDGSREPFTSFDAVFYLSEYLSAKDGNALAAASIAARGGIFDTWSYSEENAPQTGSYDSIVPAAEGQNAECVFVLTPGDSFYSWANASGRRIRFCYKGAVSDPAADLSTAETGPIEITIPVTDGQVSLYPAKRYLLFEKVIE